MLVPSLTHPTASNRAVHGSQSAHPGLWRDLKAFWCPALGRTGMDLRDYSGNGFDCNYYNTYDSDACWPVRDGVQAARLDGGAGGGFTPYLLEIPRYAEFTFDANQDFSFYIRFRYTGQNSGAGFWRSADNARGNDFLQLSSGAEPSTRIGNTTTLNASDYTAPLSVNSTYSILIAHSDGIFQNLYIDGDLIHEETSTVGSLSDGDLIRYFGWLYGENQYVAGDWFEWGFWDRCLTASEARLQHDIGAGGMFRRRPFFVALDTSGGGAASYTLDAEAGSYTVTGTAANLEYGRRLDAEAGSYAVSGTDATLSKGFTLSAEAGSYSVSGTAADLRRARALDAEAGAFSVSGTAANLERGLVLTAEAGSYSVSGTAADLRVGSGLVAEAGSYSITGTDANLEYGRVLSAESGTFTVTGSDATLTPSGGDPVLTAEAGSYTVSGTAANLECGRKISAEAGSFSVSGTDATLRQGYSLSVESGSFSVTGTEATLSRTWNLVADAGSFVVTGTAATLTYSTGVPTTADAHFSVKSRPHFTVKGKPHFSVKQ